jgi:L1 cell adhesion molecule like protein
LRKRVEAKNTLEGYCVSIKHTINDPKIEGKISPDEKETLLKKVNEVETWITSNHDAEITAFEAKQKDLENVANPIISKVYQGAEGAGPRGAPSDGQYSQQQQQQAHPGPNVDEVD